jgi:hypothetical protein
MLVLYALLIKRKEEFFLVDRPAVFRIPALEIVGDKKVGKY